MYCSIKIWGRLEGGPECCAGALRHPRDLCYSFVFFAFTFGPNVDVVKCMAGLQQEPDVRVKQQKTERLEVMSPT